LTAFDEAWRLLKEGEPLVEFGGNDICPECGTKMTQRVNQLGYGYPVIHGWDCRTCESFTPHDREYAMTPQKQSICGQCKGTGDQPHGRNKGLECDMCNGTGRGE